MAAEGPLRASCPLQAPAAAHGFSLLELLVVMFVGALLAGLAVLSMDRRDAGLEVEATRLQGVLQLASEEAVLRSRQYGLFLFIDPHNPQVLSYQWLALEENEWQELAQEPFLKHAIPAGLGLRLKVDAIEVAPAVPAKAEAPREPQLLLLSSGEINDFELEMYAQDHPEIWYRMRPDPTGTIQLENSDAGA